MFYIVVLVCSKSGYNCQRSAFYASFRWLRTCRIIQHSAANFPQRIFP